jgi:tetratricopeptide (TPR) repeat protein
LRESLTRADGTTTAIVSKALYGMGGIGKTRAAVEYAWAHRADYTALLFVQADSPEELRRNLASLAEPLELPESVVADETIRLNAALAWLGRNPGWLLILDNIDAPPALAEVGRLMGRLTGGHVILTSRLDLFPRHVEPLDLDVLSPHAAAAFLLEATDSCRHKAADDEAAASELAEELGRLALALEQAAATIDKTRWGFRRYLEAWQGNREKVVGWSKPEITGYHHAVAATWQTSVDQLTEVGRRLLERLAFLAPDPVPTLLLDVALPSIDGEDHHDGLAELTGVSLVTRQTGFDQFSLHRLVQDVSRRSLDASAHLLRVAEALGWVNTAFNSDPRDVRAWARLDPLLPHALSVSRWADMAELLAQPTSWLMNQLGILLWAKSLYTQAEPLYRRALVIAEQSFGPHHPEVATRLTNLAGLLRATNRMPEAEQLFRRAVAIDEARFGPDHPAVATDVNALALLLQDTNRLAEAEPLMRRALAIADTSFGLNHHEVAILLNNLAILLLHTNRLAEAELLIRRALAIDETSFGRDHPVVATCLNSLAGLLRTNNRLAEAEPLYLRALAIDEASFGPNHPHVAIRLNNLADLLRATNRLAEAEPLYRRTRAIDEASFGLDHPDVARDLNNLALLLQATNRLAEAESLMRRALAIVEVSFGPDHPHVARALNNLAELLRATERLAEAEPLYRRALAIDEASFGLDHPDVARDLNNLAELLRATNRQVEAEPLYRRALAIDEASFGPDHPDVARDLNNLAELLRDTNRLVDAEPLYRRALEIDEASLGADHPTVGLFLNNLAILLHATDRLAQAEPLMRRALAIFVDFEHKTGHPHPHRDVTLHNYVGLLLAMGKTEAEIEAAFVSLAAEGA